MLAIVGVQETIQIVVQLGLSVALVIFFVAQNSKREARDSERYDKLEMYVRTALSEMAKRSNEVIERNTEMFHQISQRLDIDPDHFKPRRN